MSEPEKFQPILIWQRDPYRIIKIEPEKFVIEVERKDALGNASWQHHLNIYNSPAGGGATQVLWVMLMTPKGIF